MEFQSTSFNPMLPVTAVVLLILSYYYLSQKKRQRPEVSDRKQAPSPPCAWPIIGHLHLLHNAKLPHIALGALADKYGPIFSLKLGSRLTLVVSNWEMAKESMCINDFAAASRPDLSGSRQFSYDFALFGLAPYSPYWREMRRVVHMELLSNQRVEQVKDVMFFEINTALRELEKTIMIQSSDRISVEMKTWFGDVILNMLLKIIIGKRCVGAKAEGGQEEAKQFQMAIRDSFHLMGQALVRDYIPLLEWFDFGGKMKSMKKIFKQFDKILDIWLEEHKLKKASGLDKKNRDFMDVLVSLFDGKEVAGFDGDTITKATTLNMISGGTESSTVTLTWALSLLLNNPEALEKAQQELDAVVGRERRVNESDIVNLVYLQAVVKETMRIYPPGPLLGQREFYKDCVVAGYFVPKGTQLIPNIWKIQTDPKVWPDPFKFKPERFLTTNKNVDVKGNHFELIPFGSGRRGCPAVLFGLQMVHFTLAGFLQSFEIKNPTNELIDMSENFGLANEKVTPLEVMVTPRLPNYL